MVNNYLYSAAFEYLLGVAKAHEAFMASGDIDALTVSAAASAESMVNKYGGSRTVFAVAFARSVIYSGVDFSIDPNPLVEICVVAAQEGFTPQDVALVLTTFSSSGEASPLANQIMKELSDNDE